MDYKVSLPDHDWVVAERHKLIPSVYALMKIKDSMQGDKHAVTYSGPTYIGIRSGKHCRSNAASHGRDFSDIIQSPDYEDFTQTNSGKTKPVVFFVVDGGPDENPRYWNLNNMLLCLSFLSIFCESDYFLPDMRRLLVKLYIASSNMTWIFLQSRPMLQDGVLITEWNEEWLR